MLHIFEDSFASVSSLDIENRKVSAIISLNAVFGYLNSFKQEVYSQRDMQPSNSVQRVTFNRKGKKRREKDRETADAMISTLAYALTKIMVIALAAAKERNVTGQLSRELLKFLI